MTEVCNAICTFCSSPLVPSPKAFAVHEVEHFADALRYAVCISLQGLGEPLAHPQFEEIATEIKKHLNPVAHLEIITNGWLLSGHRWELLKSLRISHIQVSVNAATDQTHQIAMGSKPGTFDRVVANIENIFADPDWRNLPETSPGLLKASMVVTRHSLPEIPQFRELPAKRASATYQPRLGFRSNGSVPRPLVWSSAKCPRTSGEGDQGHRVISQDGFSYHRDPRSVALTRQPIASLQPDPAFDR
jgi:MoaA/NifB/PqqE/SkfB family radical SAM enzyme